MSVQFVADETIRVLLWAGLRGASPIRWRSTDGSWLTLAENSAANVGALLRKANLWVFHYDPTEETWEDLGIDPVYRHADPRHTEWSAIELLRTVGYLRYQLAEPISESERMGLEQHEGARNDTVTAHRFCDALVEHLTTQLPGINVTEVIDSRLLPFSLNPSHLGRPRAADAHSVPVEHIRVLLDGLMRLFPGGFRWQLRTASHQFGLLSAQNIAEVGIMIWQWCGALEENYTHDSPVHQEWSAVELLSAARTIARIAERRSGWDESEAHNLIGVALVGLQSRIPQPDLWGIYDNTLPAALR